MSGRAPIRKGHIVTDKKANAKTQKFWSPKRKGAVRYALVSAVNPFAQMVEPVRYSRVKGAFVATATIELLGELPLIETFYSISYRARQWGLLLLYADKVARTGEPNERRCELVFLYAEEVKDCIQQIYPLSDDLDMLHRKSICICPRANKGVENGTWSVCGPGGRADSNSADAYKRIRKMMQNGLPFRAGRETRFSKMVISLLDDMLAGNTDVTGAPLPPPSDFLND